MVSLAGTSAWAACTVEAAIVQAATQRLWICRLPHSHSVEEPRVMDKDAINVSLREPYLVQ